MSISVFPAISPGFSFRPTSPFLAALAAAALRRLESPLTPDAAPPPIRRCRSASAAPCRPRGRRARAPRRDAPRGRVAAAFAGARAALAGAGLTALTVSVTLHAAPPRDARMLAQACQAFAGCHR